LLALVFVSCSGQDGRAAAPAPPAAEPAAPAAPGQRRDATVFEVINEILRDSLLQRQPISVRAKDSTLILKGAVRDEASHRRLLEIAGRHIGRFTMSDSVRVEAPAPAEAERPASDAAREP
jgi:hypothetical protein